MYKVGDMDVNVHTENKRLKISMLLRILYWPKKDLSPGINTENVIMFRFYSKISRKVCGWFDHKSFL